MTAIADMTDDELDADIALHANKVENAAQALMRRTNEKAKRKGQVAPAPSPPPTPSPTPTPTPTPALLIDGQPITGTPIVREPLVRGDLVTTRSETPLGRNLWLVTLTTGDHVSWVFENRTPGVFGPAPAPVDYTVTLGDRTFPITLHGPWQRWRIENKPWPLQPLSFIDEAISRGWIMRHRFNPLVKEDVLGIETEYRPMGNYGFLRAFGTTGGRAEIGLNHKLFARGVRKYLEGAADAQAWMDAAMLVAETHSHMPTHLRDDEGRMVQPRIPGYEKLGLQDGYGDGNPDDVFYNWDIDAGGWRLDKAHRGNAIWGKIVMQGGPDVCDPYLIEEHQFLAAATLNQSWTAYRGDNADKFTFWTRVSAWAMRDFAQTVAVTPATVPDWLLPKDFFQPNLDDIAQEYTERFSVEPGRTFGTTHPASYFKDATSKASNVEDYNAFTLLHVYRLTGDAKWRDLAHHFAERKLAANYVAADLWHRDYLYPMGADGQFHADWKAQHEARGHAPLSGQWYRFDKPFADGNSGADVAMQNYDALKLARDSGAGSALIDQAIAILEKQYTGNSMGAHTRSSQDQFAVEWTAVG